MTEITNFLIINHYCLFVRHCEERSNLWLAIRTCALASPDLQCGTGFAVSHSFWLFISFPKAINPLQQ